MAGGNHASSGIFKLAFPLDDTGKNYEIFETPGLNGKLYTSRDENNDIIKIKGVKEVDTQKHGRVEITTIMTKRIDRAIDVEVSIKNLNEEAIKFAYLKHVDTELAGNDAVPVKMLNENEGLYIEANSYRLNYVTKVDNGPDNFRNWYYGGYRYTGRDHYGNKSLPFFPSNDLNGVGDESKGYAPDAEVIGRGDSGIWMKWNVSSLQPNESRTFAYRIGLFNRFKSSLDATNTTRNTDAFVNEDNYTKDKITVKSGINVIESVKTGVASGTLVSKLQLQSDNGPLDEKVSIQTPIRILDKNANVLRSVEPTAFNYETQTVTIPFTESDIMDGKVFFEYDLTANQLQDNSYSNKNKKLNIANTYTVQFKDFFETGSIEKKHLRFVKHTR